MGFEDDLRGNLEKVRARIERAAKKCGRKADEITFVAVSKTFPAEAIRAAYGLGLRQFGENRVQEWEEKREKLADLEATWHLIGHLQSNKARRAAFLFKRIDSVDDLALAKKLDAAAAAEGKMLPILIEVHLGGEETKSGVDPEELPRLAEGVAPFAHIDLLGLMTIPPFFEDPERTRPHFARLRDLRDDVSHRIGRKLPALSMGMSHDFEVAIEEGATEIRVGSALFGQRKTSA
ncbi:MAG TPA: YggS family pyridoxal phosphate-dependent enzyme [Candidatus Acidoferrum sp.]|nr:YggS family pyridoxal phosphate-dependent enzyme [Candidatus Acidoferrum sp.]